MLLNYLLLIFVFFRILSAKDDRCRFLQLDIPENFEDFHSHTIEEKLFYKTDAICQNKPVFRSMKHPTIYQFQSPTNRWWTLYEMRNSTDRFGMSEWCDAWNGKALLSMSLGMFQHPLGKQPKLQRWYRVINHPQNKSYSYKSISNVQLKCYSPRSLSTCQTRQLTFLFDLTETTNNEEFQRMKFFTKNLIWLLYNQTKIAVSYYRDRLHLLHSFDNKTSAKSLEHLFDSIDTINENIQLPKRFTVRWTEAIQQVVTQIYKRRFLLPVPRVHLNESFSSASNDSLDDEIYTEPYPLVYSDEQAIKTILNISTSLQRGKRSIRTKYNPLDHLLVILTSRSKNLYDYKQSDRRLAQFISSVPIRIVVIDFNELSNTNFAENIHSAFIHNAKYALASLPVPYNYIEISEQFIEHYQRLCHPIKENLTTILIETKENANADCSLLTLLDNSNANASLKEKFDYTFYQTSDQCFSAPVYRSVGDRNIYLQKMTNGRWVIVHVDPLVPSTMSVQQKFASTTTSTLSPEMFYATDYAHGPMIDERNNESFILDFPTSIPHCSNNPGLNLLWESDDTNDDSLYTHRQWISRTNRSGFISPVCNKYRVSCRRMSYDFLILIDTPRDYSALIQMFFKVFLALLEPFHHRFSLAVLSSRTIDTFQYHLPFTSINTINQQILDNYLAYTDAENTSIFQLNQHIERLSEYLINHQQSIVESPSKSILFTISSRLNFNENDMKSLVQRYSTIRYMAIDPYLRTDDDENIQEREKLLRTLVSSPWHTNFFWSYAASRDLTFNTVFRVLESLCGSIR